MAEDKNKLDELEDLFAAARSNPAGPPTALRDRIVQDAYAIQAEFQAEMPVTSKRSTASEGWVRQVSAMLGGWAGLGGLATACAAGVWIGFAPPAALPDPAALVLQEETTDYDLFQGTDFALAFDIGGE